jgi:predicted DsbA family dithiol-disulfide isomerase
MAASNSNINKYWGGSNMPALEVFFDYACPYCLRGHEYLTALLPEYPGIEVAWRPCEAHPRPEKYGPHSDLCIQGLYYALEQGADIWEYHARMYAAAVRDRVNIEDPEAVAGRVRGLLDPDAFLRALRSGRYAKAVSDGNDYAYELSGVWAVPSYRMDGRKLDAVEGVGVTKDQLAAFLGFRA